MIDLIRKVIDGMNELIMSLGDEEESEDDGDMD